MQGNGSLYCMPVAALQDVPFFDRVVWCCLCAQTQDCGGSGLCEHLRRKARCKECNADICEHKRPRRQCPDCSMADAVGAPSGLAGMGSMGSMGMSMGMGMPHDANSASLASLLSSSPHAVQTHLVHPLAPPAPDGGSGTDIAPTVVGGALGEIGLSIDSGSKKGPLSTARAVWHQVGPGSRDEVAAGHVHTPAGMMLAGGIGADVGLAHAVGGMGGEDASLDVDSPASSMAESTQKYCEHRRIKRQVPCFFACGPVCVFVRSSAGRC